MNQVYKHPHLVYPELTMFQMVENIVKQYPDSIAYEFFGKKTDYAHFLKYIEQAARAFRHIGISKGDAVTICMPNVPQGLIAFYELDRIGAVANMVHPLSAESEIVFYLNISESRAILTMDMFAEKVERAVSACDNEVKVILARMTDELPVLYGAAFLAKTGRKFLKYPNTSHAMTWKEFLNNADRKMSLPAVRYDAERTSVILYSGGSTGTPKGIMLSDRNMNALALQCREAIPTDFKPGMIMLSCMPMFHGFGLGVNIHTALTHGLTCVLMPTFNIKNYADALIKNKPNFIAGVPTIFEALLHMPQLEGKSLEHIQGVFCGGDSLSVELKKKVDRFLEEHGAQTQIREGYGLTECVTASCLTPWNDYREGSIGLPFPDTYYAIVKPGTDEVCLPHEEGEIILSGPSVMLGYLKNPEETAKTLRVLSDGRTWLYTGDAGYMDEDGYVYFRQRIKRMIITNGYNVYPGQIENIIDSCDEVSYSCVIGVKDKRRGQYVKAYVVLRDGVPASDEVKQHIMDVLHQHVAKYALPREIEFRSELPKTLVGKVFFRKLEEEANALVDQQEENAE